MSSGRKLPQDVNDSDQRMDWIGELFWIWLPLHPVPTYASWLRACRASAKELRFHWRICSPSRFENGTVNLLRFARRTVIVFFSLSKLWFRQRFLLREGAEEFFQSLVSYGQKRKLWQWNTGRWCSSSRYVIRDSMTWPAFAASFSGDVISVCHSAFEQRCTCRS